MALGAAAEQRPDHQLGWAQIDCMESGEQLLGSSRVLVAQGVGLIGLKVASPDPLAGVKRIALIAVAASLLAGCQSSQEFALSTKAAMPRTPRP